MISQRWGDLLDDKGVNGRVKGHKKERTNDPDFEVITGAAKERFLLLRRCLFWRHPLFDGGERCKRKRKLTKGGGKAGEQSQSIQHFLKGGLKKHGALHPSLPPSPPPAAATSALDEVLLCPHSPFPHNFRLGPTDYNHQWVCFLLPHLSFVVKPLQGQASPSSSKLPRMPWARL